MDQNSTTVDVPSSVKARDQDNGKKSRQQGDPPQAKEKYDSGDGGRVSIRRFWFDLESVRANSRRVLVKATDNEGRQCTFQIVLDERVTEKGAKPDADSVLFRSHQPADHTEVIVGILPSEPMLSLVERILHPQDQHGIDVKVATYPVRPV